MAIIRLRASVGAGAAGSNLSSRRSSTSGRNARTAASRSSRPTRPADRRAEKRSGWSQHPSPIAASDAGGNLEVLEIRTSSKIQADRCPTGIGTGSTGSWCKPRPVNLLTKSWTGRKASAVSPAQVAPASTNVVAIDKASEAIAWQRTSGMPGRSERGVRGAAPAARAAWTAGRSPASTATASAALRAEDGFAMEFPSGGWRTAMTKRPARCLGGKHHNGRNYETHRWTHDVVVPRRSCTSTGGLD